MWVLIHPTIYFIHIVHLNRKTLKDEVTLTKVEKSMHHITTI